MKKKVVIGMIAVNMTIIAVFNLSLGAYSTGCTHSTLSIVNLEALAQNNNEGEKKEGYSTIECVDITIIDIDGNVTTSEMSICTGSGTKECKCS